MDLKISIVTPSFNQGAFIAEAIESAVDQHYPAIEHIVVDNCSTDATREILNGCSHIKLICEKDHGQSDALNKGFKAATGDIIGWLNADDKYLPGCFEAVIKAFSGKSDCDVIYGDYRLVDMKGEVVCLRKELSFDMFMLKYLHVLYVPSTTCFFRRKVFDEGNFLDIKYHYAMDYEFFVRLSRKGYKFGHISKMMADFRTYPESKSRRQTRLQKEEMEKALLEHDPFLKGLRYPWRPVVRHSLMLAARAKRTSLKFLQGAYL
jgi:glycosyltransferase involved in cell wall biosynthesis